MIDLGGSGAAEPLHLDSDHDRLDLAGFAGRVERLEPATLIRLVATGTRLTCYARYRQQLASRAVPLAEPVPTARYDVTVGAAQLPLLLEPPPEGGRARLLVPAAAVRDHDWRWSLPPVSGWRRIETVPVPAIDAAVRAAVAAYEVARADDGGRLEALTAAVLDQAALTVSDDQHEVVLPMAVLYAAVRLGFLGPEPGRAQGLACAVSAAGSWSRLAAPYGSVYHRPAAGGLLL